MTPPTGLWSETPLIYSDYISRNVGCSAFLKLENLHISHSFKYRGISHFCRLAAEKHGSSVHLVIASGGNAGLAAACAAKVLKVRCTVYIPEGVAERTLAFLKSQEAEVVIIGRFYAEALIAAKETAAREEHAVLVPAYEDPAVWEGHSSMIYEISDQLKRKPAAIFCSVGGAGLLGGLIDGCKHVGWDDVPIVAIETIGSNCFHYSMLLNQNGSSSFATQLPSETEPVELEDGTKICLFHRFSSKASGSLGASRPAEGVVRTALQRAGGVRCVSVPDELSMDAALKFADDHKFLVELSCSTALTPAYNRALFDKVVPSAGDAERVVVFIVCGGFKITLEDMDEYKRLVEVAMAEGLESVVDDGETVRTA